MGNRTSVEVLDRVALIGAGVAIAFGLGLAVITQVLHEPDDGANFGLGMGVMLAIVAFAAVRLLLRARHDGVGSQTDRVGGYVLAALACLPLVGGLVALIGDFVGGG